MDSSNLLAIQCLIGGGTGGKLQTYFYGVDGYVGIQSESKLDLGRCCSLSGWGIRKSSSQKFYAGGKATAGVVNVQDTTTPFLVGAHQFDGRHMVCLINTIGIYFQALYKELIRALTN